MAYLLKVILITFVLSSSLFATNKIIVGSFANYSGAEKRLHKIMKFLESNTIVRKVESKNKFYLSIIKSSSYHIVLIEPFFDSSSLKLVFKEVKRFSKDAYIFRTEEKIIGGYKKFFLKKKKKYYKRVKVEVVTKKEEPIRIEVKKIEKIKEDVLVEKKITPPLKQNEIFEKFTGGTQKGKYALYAVFVLGFLFLVLCFLLISNRKILFGKKL